MFAIIHVLFIFLFRLQLQCRKCTPVSIGVSSCITRMMFLSIWTKRRDAARGSADNLSAPKRFILITGRKSTVLHSYESSESSTANWVWPRVELGTSVWCVCVCHFQLVTTIPTRQLPKKLVLGEVTHEEIKQMDKSVEDDQADEAGQRGQYLWIRGLTRLQHQVHTHTHTRARAHTHTHTRHCCCCCCGPKTSQTRRISGDLDVSEEFLMITACRWTQLLFKPWAKSWIYALAHLNLPTASFKRIS